ncbi:hypothetical protein CEE37_07810 [candidate division LCP-89 bacterium B3_LCP]|uniref:2-(3-amino-3-carboxypropyl)histidine synthase n=1 Tax=candidate division LCP-89 bacterium B3_LCP TaxID=2012998 RepID=A0A532UZ40_UNCL8|nr:MAG: hypothetical protein CEE37_07810 [candidate division LCP-89 bacterium B3_LCP]
MKTLFIESKFKGKIELNKIKVNELQKNIGLITVVQFVNHLEKIKNYLLKNNKKIQIAKGNQKYKAQILGCDISAGYKIKNKVDAFLYIGDGKFHPWGLAIKTKKEVFSFNPLNNDFSRIKKEEIEKYKRTQKIKKIRFLSAENIGILVSTKPGQSNLKKALEIKNKLEKKGKKCFIFVFDTLNLNDLENFPFIDMWLNTACPRIEEDSRDIINFEDIPKRN